VQGAVGKNMGLRHSLAPEGGGDQRTSAALYVSHAPIVFEYGNNNHGLEFLEPRNNGDEPPDILQTNSTSHRLVEIYVPHCALCRHMVDLFVRLADSLLQQTIQSANKNITLTVHAIDCVRFADLCHLQKVSQFPIVLAYKPHNIKGISIPLQHLNPLTSWSNWICCSWWAQREQTEQASTPHTTGGCPSDNDDPEHSSAAMCT
jgi:hypothetical protein